MNGSGMKHQTLNRRVTKGIKQIEVEIEIEIEIELVKRTGEKCALRVTFW
jgi:hypothetical protein